MANGAETLLLQITDQLMGLQENQSDDNTSSEIVYLIPSELRDNPLNAARIIEQEDVDHLADSLLIEGLQQPLVVTPHEDKKLYLVSGHRRLRAIKKLFKNNRSYVFAGKQMVDKVPCIIKTFDSSLQEKISVLSGNSHKDETEEEKIARTLAADGIYEEWRDHAEVNKIKTILTRREFISAITGYSERSVGRYLKKGGCTKQIKSFKNDDIFYKALADKLQLKLCTKVEFQGKKLVIRFKDTEDINRILEDMGYGNIMNE